MRKLIIFLLFSISFSLFSQDCKQSFDKKIKDVTETSDGNFTFISDNFKLTKVNSSFDTIWQNSHLDTSGNILLKIRSTFDGGYIGVGSGSRGNLFKIDSLGDSVWVKDCQILGFGPFGGYKISDILQTSDSGFAFIAVYGHMSNNSAVVKIDNLGNILWSNMGILSNPNSFDNQAKNIIESDNGDLIVSGIVNVYFPTNNTYSYLYRFNNLGDSVWAKTYDNYHFNSFLNDSDGNFIIAGQEINASNIAAPRIIKINTLGDTVWTKQKKAHLINTVQLADNGYVFGGSIDSNSTFNSSYFLKTNKKGETQWSRSFEEDTTNSQLNMILRLRDNSYLLFGEDYPNFSSLNNHMDYRIKVDSLGYCKIASNSIAEVDSPSIINCYPNPTNQDVFIETWGDYNGNIKTEVFTLTGDKLMKTDSNLISLADYPKGIYFFKIIYGNSADKIKVIKIIKN
jgi:hypothetical protein|tara:strand:+ start:8615 stop:9979 length:1365 start_codon:yes stop_codon:yes gene_type:complete